MSFVSGVSGGSFSLNVFQTFDDLCPPIETRVTFNTTYTEAAPSLSKLLVNVCVIALYLGQCSLLFCEGELSYLMCNLV